MKRERKEMINKIINRQHKNSQQLNGYVQCVYVSLETTYFLKVIFLNQKKINKYILIYKPINF